MIALPFVTLVRELVLLVDAKGYTPLDAPVLKVCVGNTVEGVEQYLALTPSTKRRSAGDAPQPAYAKDANVAFGVGEWAVDMEGYPLAMIVI